MGYLQTLGDLPLFPLPAPPWLSPEVAPASPKPSLPPALPLCVPAGLWWALKLPDGVRG